MITIRTWEFSDYDILTFIWNCPHCQIQVGTDGHTVNRIEKATCPVCKAEIKIIKSIRTDRIDTDPKYSEPNLTDIEISKSYTKQELLLDIDLVLEDFRDRLSKEVEIMKKSAASIPDTFVLHLEDIDSVLDKMEKSGRGYMNALSELKKEVKALKVYQGAPID